MKEILLIILVTLSFSCQKGDNKIENQLSELELSLSNFKKIDTTLNVHGGIESLTLHKSKSNYYKVSFYEDGSKKQLYQVKNEQMHGKAIDWFSDGKQKWVREYKDGAQIGENIIFQPNGSKKELFDTESKSHILFFENGKPRVKYTNTGTTYYYDNGKPFEEYIYNLNSEGEDTGSGKVNFYNENGELTFTGSYDNSTFSKNGKKYTGEIICYFKSGKPSMYFNLQNGINNGEYYCFHGNGNLKFKGETIAGEKIYYKSYFPDGSQSYEQDKRNDIEKNWDENGNLIE